LAWPAMTSIPTEQVDLPNPILTNTLKIDNGIIYRMAKDGSIYSFKVNKVLQQFTMQFTNIDWDTIEDLKDLLRVMFQSTVTLKWFDDTNYIGYITNLPLDIVKDHKGDGVREGKASFSLEFDGYTSTVEYI